MSEPLTLLVVDDSKVSRIMSTGYLRKHRPALRVLEASHADEACALIAREQPDWLLLDHNMPGRSGLDLAEQLRAERPTLRIALLTANVQDATQARAQALGVHFFRKPITENVVLEVLRTLEAAGPLSANHEAHA